MLTFLDRTIGFIAPHRCLACGKTGSLLCAICLPLLPDMHPQCYRCHNTSNGNATCKRCRKESPLVQVWLRTPYEGFGEALLKRLKFERALAAADTIARSLAQGFDLPEGSVLVPVPTATSRVRQRGYDQSVMIARALAKYTALPCIIGLERYGQQRQTGSTRRQRLAQLEDAFRARKNKLANIDHAILVDDVMTTGATLEAASRVLKQAGVKQVSALAFARAE